MGQSESEFEKTDHMKSQLGSVSPTFCLVRWKHATLNLASGASKSCCHHEFKSIDLNGGFNQLHDNLKERKLRAQMLSGKRTKDCSYCWWVEDNGHSSDRQNWSAKSWMRPFFNQVTENLSPEPSTPSWVELNFSSLCNLKCLYCSPIFSTKWYEEIKVHGPYPTLVPHNSIQDLNHIEYEERYENTKLLEQFWPWFHHNLPGIHLLKITGGEPLLSPQTFKMLDMMSELHNPDLAFGINSNLSVPEKLWTTFLHKIKTLESNRSVGRIYLHPSLDSFGTRAEYIRSGLNLQVFKANLEGYLKETSAHVHFICTLNNLALGGLKEYWEYLLLLKQKYFKAGREISLGTEILQYPSWLNLNILPKAMGGHLDEVVAFVEQNLDESGRGFLGAELEGLKKAKSAFDSKPDNLLESKINFSRFIAEADRRRGTDFCDTFPELAEFYFECKTTSDAALKTNSAFFSP